MRLCSVGGRRRSTPPAVSTPPLNPPAGGIPIQRPFLAYVLSPSSCGPPYDGIHPKPSQCGGSWPTPPISIVEYIISYSQILGCNNNWIIMIFLIMEQMQKITNTSIELFLMVMWWRCLWSLWKGNMVILMLMIIHLIVTILSSCLHLHIPFKQTWVLMVKLFIMVKWYVKEPNSLWSISILINMFYKNKSNNTIVSLSTIKNGNVNIICYDLEDIFPPCLRSTTQWLQYTATPTYHN